MRKLILAVILLAVLPVASAFAYTGLAPDGIVFFEEVDQSKVLAQMVDGDTQLYGNAFTATLYQDILDYGLPVTFSYGSFNELLLNPAVDENDDPFFQDGRFNPFGIQVVREAMYYLIDRNYIIEEILVGLGVARWTMLDPNFPPYTQAIEAARAIELIYQADDAAAAALIKSGMEGAGAVLDSVWKYNDEPIVLIGTIRVEDERLEIGNYFADKLEAQGFTVDRVQRTSAELSPIWLLSDPTEGQWSYYTGGWISNLIDRDQGGDFDFMYTPRGWAVPLNQGYPMHLFPAADAAFDKLARRDYSTVAERVTLLGIAEQGAADCAWNQWLFSAASPWATASDVSVLVDVAAGISGAFIWAHTARFVDADGAPVVGGTMRMASPSMMTQPWNP
ncbi:MAG: ABC transporter substrate-binding protein, partial [Candidatus Bipolaricaulia bacterium]